MAKAGRPKKKNDLLLDLESLKQAVKNVTITAADTGHVPSIIEFVESEKYLGLPVKKPTPIDLTTNLTASVSQLSDHVHRELVRKTVEIASKDIEAYNRMQAEQATNNTYRE